jgi:hypothetical protein
MNGFAHEHKMSHNVDGDDISREISAIVLLTGDKFHQLTVIYSLSLSLSLRSRGQPLSTLSQPRSKGIIIIDERFFA